MSERTIRSTARKFYNSDGEEVTLRQLCRTEPEWAKNRILDLEEQAEKLRQELSECKAARSTDIESAARALEDHDMLEEAEKLRKLYIGDHP